MNSQIKHILSVAGLVGFVFLIQYIDSHFNLPGADVIRQFTFRHRHLSPSFAYVVMLTFGFFITRFIILNIGVKLFLIVTYKPCRKVSSNKALPNNLVKKMSIGGIFAEQQLMTSNSLQTGVPKFIIKGVLKKDWKILNRETALESIRFLKDMKHSGSFENALNLYKGKINADSLSKGELNSANEWLSDLNCCAKDLIIKYAYTESDFSKGIVPWDMGRLIGVSRMCYDCQYISREETIGNIEYAYEQCSGRYNSWEEIRKAYILGRVIWQGDVMALEAVNTFVKRMETSVQSPWKEFSFNY